MMYKFKGVKVLSDTSTDEINNVVYREMIAVYKCDEYAYMLSKAPMSHLMCLLSKTREIQSMYINVYDIFKQSVSLREQSLALSKA